MSSVHEIPYVSKEQISLVVIGDALEAVALRGILERFNYRVEVHWVGSRKEALAIISGDIKTYPYVVISCHGDECGDILVPDEPVIQIGDLDVSMPHHVVVNLGCGTGQNEAATRYLDGGCSAYIAPSEAVDANTALLFATHLFYFLGAGLTLVDAFNRAQTFDEESGLFRCWEAVATGA